MSDNTIQPSTGELGVELAWDEYNTGLFTDKLYRHVRKNEHTFELHARPGSLITDFLIGAAQVATGSTFSGIILYLYKRREKMQSNPQRLPPATIVARIDGETRRISLEDEESLERALEVAEIIEDDAQSELDDF